MTEGLDLRGELSRFQIVAKAPFLNLADPYIKRRMAIDNDWYTWSACLALAQGLGRSIRSKEDYARSYILDADTMRLLKSNFLPDWWLSAVEFK